MHFYKVGMAYGRHTAHFQFRIGGRLETEDFSPNSPCGQINQISLAEYTE